MTNRPLSERARDAIETAIETVGTEMRLANSDSWRSKLTTDLAVLRKLRKEIATLEAERDRLREALGLYGVHDADCDLLAPDFHDRPDPCSCGLSTALEGGDGE